MHNKPFQKLVRVSIFTKTMVGVAQLVELRVVIPAVVGSIPIVHPMALGPLAQLGRAVDS